MTFAEATLLTDAGDGRFSARLEPEWDAFGGIANGGYLLALAARAAVRITGREDPITVSAHYLGPGRTGSAVDIHTRTLKAGRQFGVASVEMAQAGSAILAALATCGSAPEQGIHLGRPDLPPPADCPLVVPADPLPPPMTGQVETRLHPDDAFTVIGPTGHARLRGWFRLLNGEPLTTLSAVLATDTWPPPLFVSDGPTGWFPTLELTVQIRSRPQGEWLACDFGHNIVGDGLVSWDGTITDEDGVLVATCRQLCLMAR